MISRTDRTYGPASANRLHEAGDPTPAGARAALESFYFALNNRDDRVLREVWADDALAQLNNPVGGILHGGDAISELYARIVRGRVRLTVTFGEVVEYLGTDHAVFAGRERGSYVTGERPPTPLLIRTTRYLRYADGRWWQYHHHGSIDAADALRAYQDAVAGRSTDGVIEIDRNRSPAARSALA